MVKENSYQRIMAIDYGEKRIGIALTDPLLIFAYPYKTFLNDEKFFDNIAGVIEDKNVTKIILGLPLKENGEEYALTKSVLAFKLNLESKLSVEVLLRDERYTSSIAQNVIIQSVNKKSKRKDKSLIDRGAAAIILEDYLNELKKKQ